MPVRLGMLRCMMREQVHASPPPEANSTIAAGRRKPRYYYSPVRILGILSASVFASGYVSMSILAQFSLPPRTEALIGSALLALVLLPVFYWFLLRPLLHHIDASRRTNADLEESITRSEKIVACAFDAIIVIDAQGLIRDFNPAAERIFGFSAAEITGRSVNQLMPEPFCSAHDGYIAAYLSSGQPKIIGKGREVVGQRSNGSTFPMELAVTEMRVHGRPAFVGTIRDITRRKRDEAALRQANEELEGKVQARTAELAQANEELHVIATTDALTGIVNRRQFDVELTQELERARRYGLPFALILFDIDYFKDVNDRYGHLTGDTVLTALARLVSAQTRANDIFARWGGEEFVLLVQGIDAGDAPQLAEKLRTLIGAHAFPHGQPVSCSFGVTGYLADDDSVSIMQRADKALYQAKTDGRNRVVLA